MKKIYYLTMLLWGLIIMTSLKAQTLAGLAVVANYPDAPFTAGLDTLTQMFNQVSGFTAWNNNGSVREYFYHQTAGKYDMVHLVIEVDLDNNYNYYHATGLPYDGGQLFIKDVVEKINIQYSDGFNGLTKAIGKNQIHSFVVLSQGPSEFGAAYETPDAGSILNDDLPLPVKNVSSISYEYDKPTIGVVCHEFGHSVFYWTDFYNTRSTLGSNFGHYCLMGSGGSPGFPMPVSAGLRYLDGWIDNIVDITGNTTQTYQIVTNDRNTVFKYTNVLNNKEYYLIEALKHSRYYIPVTGESYLTDEGLAIWYVDEDGGFDNPPSTFNLNPRIKLVQSDGKDDMGNDYAPHVNRRGDNDLFDNVRSVFNDSLFPQFGWKDGSQSGLIITDISEVSDTMSFKVNARPSTIWAIAGDNGKILPGGPVSVRTGQSKTFQIKPDFGYETEFLGVNSFSIPVASSHTFTSVSSDHSIQALFKRSTSGYDLPSPWTHAYIGAGSNTGWAGFKSDTFGIEGHGGDIWGGNDDFNYIYRSLSGNGEIVARVSDLNMPQDWLKAGLMIRENLNSNSRHVMMVRVSGNGIAPQYRPETEGETYHNINRNEVDTIQSTTWLKITRTGDVFTTFYSKNGTIWSSLDTYWVDMGTNVYVGLCITGATANEPAKALFDHVSVVGSSAPSLLSTFGVPRTTGLPSVNRNYTHVHVLGTGGPNLSDVTQTQFNWDLSNNGLYQFAFQTNNGVPSWYLSLASYTTRFLNTSSPGLTINSSTGITNLDGTYYANLDGTNLVLVEQSGAYALYFSNSATPPLRQGANFESYASSVRLFPNPFQDKITIEVPAGMQNATLVATDVRGIEVERAIVNTGTIVIGNGYASGLYFVHIKKDEYSEVSKIIKK